MFGFELEVSIVVFEISALEFIEIEFWTNADNLGIGDTFFKGPRFTLLEGLYPGLGPLYKICTPRYALQFIYNSSIIKQFKAM